MNSAEQNVQRLKRFYEEAARGKWSAALDLLDPLVEWVEPNVRGLWFRGTHLGVDAVFREVIKPTLDHVSEFCVDIEQFFPVGDHIIALGQFRGRGKQTGKELNAPTAHIWTFRADKAVRFEAYQDIPRWLEALGETRTESERFAA